MATTEHRVPCPTCAELILPGAKACPHCGKWTRRRRVRPGVWILMIAILIIGLVVISGSV